MPANNKGRACLNNTNHMDEWTKQRERAHTCSAQHPVHYLPCRFVIFYSIKVGEVIHVFPGVSAFRLRAKSNRNWLRCGTNLNTGSGDRAQPAACLKRTAEGAPLRMDVANNAAVANADATHSGWFWLAPGGGLHLFQRCQGYGKSSSSSGLGHAIGTRERRREQRYASLPQRAIGDRLGSRKRTGTRGYFFVLSQASSEPLRSGASVRAMDRSLYHSLERCDVGIVVVGSRCSVVFFFFQFSFFEGDLGLAGPSSQDDDLQIGGRFLRAERRTRSPVKPPGREVWT
ncbi:hypothetical protein BKA56DRAFT_35063 [Ilyonectria sp. MPI-CAGE-AT-0026]|nr:hypothetical protein BKA56DRAFT_35063 [Ilyonectria sp. MPI-CAGE-AT-0026]